MKAYATEGSARKAAFTLVELMVVIGLMALLGTVSVTGYFAAVRGMTERAAMQDTISIIRQAMQVCLIDQTPTAVLFYNRQTQTKQEGESEDDLKASSVGTAVAIKMAGRISYISGDILVDEFADWNQSYPVTTSGNQSSSDVGIPFYRMANLAGEVKNGIDKCRAFVYTAVEPVRFDNEYMIAYGGQVQHFCQEYNKRGQDNKKFSLSSYNNGNNQRWGRRIKQGNGLSWKVGDAYGVEIATLQLPNGFVYGSKAADSTKINPAGALTFSPSDLVSADAYEMNLDQTITISTFGGVKMRKIGDITSNDLRDDAK
jgi:type II secretory pathway pseudopilin PulG